MINDEPCDIVSGKLSLLNWKVCLTHHAIVYERTKQCSVYLTNEHLFLRNFHVESKLVVGNKIQVLLKDLSSVYHARQDSQWLSREHSTSNDFRKERHSNLHVGNSPKNAIREGKNGGRNSDNEEPPELLVRWIAWNCKVRVNLPPW